MTKKRDDEAKSILKKYAKSKNVELLEEDWNSVVETENEKFGVSGDTLRKCFQLWPNITANILVMLSSREPSTVVCNSACYTGVD